MTPWLVMPVYGNRLTGHQQMESLVAVECICGYKIRMRDIRFALAVIAALMPIACSDSDSSGSSAFISIEKIKWTALYWTNSNRGKSFDWTLPTDGSIGRLIAMPTNSNDNCSAWGGMDTPGITAQGALDAWVASGGSSGDFEVWMRARDGQNPTASAINTFDGCVQQDCPTCPKATGVLCILDSGSANTCLSPPPAGYTYGVMRGPQMMGTFSSYAYEEARSLSQVHFGEVYDLSISTPCPSTGRDFGNFVETYVDAHANSRGATNAAPTFGGNGATCPLAPDQLPDALEAMSTQYFDRIGLWSS